MALARGWCGRRAGAGCTEGCGRECHIDRESLAICRADANPIVFARAGTHPERFNACASGSSRCVYSREATRHDARPLIGAPEMNHENEPEQDREEDDEEERSGRTRMNYPPWVVLHVPHDSTVVPADVREQFTLDDAELAQELNRMTDHRTLELFRDPASAAVVVRAPVSRLVVDVERFVDDADEPMAARGMGAVYTMTSQLAPLRRQLGASDREALIHTYYRPHHARLEAAVAAVLERHGRCLVIDCHSFPDTLLPYEGADPCVARPHICIGTDDFHTSAALAGSFTEAFRRAGWTVRLNEPFAGALVPRSRYRRDPRVAAVMVEINRRLYLREDDASRLPGFTQVAGRIRTSCAEAIARYVSSGHD
jgi:N-formylglutamate amidohydrolase